MDKQKTKSTKSLHLKIKRKISLFAFIIVVLYAVIIYNMYFSKNKTYAKEEKISAEDIKISNAQTVDIDEIINNNTNQGTRIEYIVEEEILEYIVKYKENSQLPKGVVQVLQEGREGKQEITKKRTYKENELISEEQVFAKVTKASINKIVEIGTSKYTSNYTVKVGDVVYVTSDRLSVMSEANSESQKVATFVRNDELKVQEISGQWYKVISGTVRGYVKAECTTYINPNQEFKENTDTQVKSKEELSGNLSFNMQLNKPSGLTLEQFKKVLTDSKDVNKIMENNAEYFYYIEKQYNINGIFVASVAIHESAWGTSKIAKDKKNLFGYGAYDSNPYNGAYSFSDYSESIDLISRVFVKYYINPSGTSIYGGEQALGTYYNGATLSGVNVRYATDKNWAKSVYEYMKYLYGKI